MKKKSIFVLVFLILFNFISINFIIYNSNKNISFASSNKDNIPKSYFASLMQNSGYEISDSNFFNSTYNKFIDSLDSIKKSEFYKNSKEFTVRKLFKGKESVKHLVSNNILKNDTDWQRAFKGNLDTVFSFLNKAYYDYASNDNIEFKGNYNNFYYEVIDHYKTDVYFKDFKYRKVYGNYRSTSGFNDGYITWDYFSANFDDSDISNLSYIKDSYVINDSYATRISLYQTHKNNDYRSLTGDVFNKGNSNDCSIRFANIDSGDGPTLYKKFYGYNFKDKFSYESILIYGYKKDDNDNIILDGNVVVAFGGPTYSFDVKSLLNDPDNIESIKDAIEYQGNSSLPFKNLTGIKKVVNKSYNYTFNSPNYHYYIDDSKLSEYTNNDIVYNIYNNGSDLNDSIDSLLNYIDSSDDYLTDYLDYLYNGKIKENFDEIKLAIDKNNNIVVDTEEIINKIDESKVDYEVIDDIVKNYTDKLYNKFISDVNKNLNVINTKINNVDKELQVIKENNVNQYLDIKKELESLNHEFQNFKNSSDLDSETGAEIKDYTEDFENIDKRFDELSVAYSSNFDKLNDKIDNLELSNINYTDEEKGNLKDNIFGFFDFLKSIKDFFSNFFVVTEEINVDSFKEIDFKNKFPFSIPFDLVKMFKNLTADSQAPIFTFHFISEEIVLDFSKFESLAKIIKGFSLLFFVVFLMIKTFDKLGG